MNCNLKRRRRQYVKINLCNFSKKKYMHPLYKLFGLIFFLSMYTRHISLLVMEGKPTKAWCLKHSLSLYSFLWKEHHLTIVLWFMYTWIELDTIIPKQKKAINQSMMFETLFTARFFFERTFDGTSSVRVTFYCIFLIQAWL